MTELRRRMIEDMRLHGLSERTRDSYARAVAGLARHYGRSPDRLSQDEIQAFFLHLREDPGASHSTVNVYLAGIRFLYEKTLRRRWPVLRLIRSRKRRRLPIALSAGEVEAILSRVDHPLAKPCLTTIYACGLRLTEGARLRVRDIDSDRMMIRIDQGKGAKDRYVPFSNRLLDLLRDYWRRQRPREYLFPGKRPGHYVCVSTIQRAFKMALASSAVAKQASVHTLRHSYATHLLEQGVSLPLIQQILGHRSPQTTAIYTHVTRKSVDELRAAVDGLIANV